MNHGVHNKCTDGTKGNDATWSAIDGTCNLSHELTSRLYFTFAVIFDAGCVMLALAGVHILWSPNVGQLCLALYHQVLFSNQSN